MTKHKLKLKRTPEEEAEHLLRKEQKREKKRKREQGQYKSSSKRYHSEDVPPRKWASSDEDDDVCGPQQATSSRSHKYPSDYDALKAEIEEQMFREKMFDALGDDERLDSVEAQFNDFAHVPDHWRSDKGKNKARVYDDEGLLNLDPRTMDDEEYAEWVRAGMYRKTHAEEYAEQQRQKAAHAARRAEEKARKAESKRLEKEAEEERKRKKVERESRKFKQARDDYNIRWAELLASTTDVTSGQQLAFDDIPWPIAPSQRQRSRYSMEDLTLEAISAFLLAVETTSSETEDERKKLRRDRLREAFRRFHPDKFEGRFMKRVKDDDKDQVRDAIGQVSRVLNTLMSDDGG